MKKKLVGALLITAMMATILAVSYTHLDVYKRQEKGCRSCCHPQLPDAVSGLRRCQVRDRRLL